jgi:hypothetical protein
MLKNPAEYDRYFLGRINGNFSLKFLCASLLGVCWYLPESFGG